MGDTNPIRTLGDYSKPRHEGYMNTIELLVGNNVVPLRSDTIWLVQNRCLFHRLRSEDLNQPLKDFLKLVDSLDLDGDDDDVMFIKIVQKHDNSCDKEPEAGEQEVEYFDTFSTMSEIVYHKYLMCGPIPSIFLRNPIITEGSPSNLKILCNIGHVHVEKAYIDLNSLMNVMTRMLYNWVMRRKLNPREDTNRGVSNFIGRIKGMHVFIGNFTYVLDFMIIEDISSIIDPRLSQVVLGKPFVDISNMTHDPPEGVVRFTNETY
nr:MAK10-like protein [Tanacetum cinerariifolium]